MWIEVDFFGTKIQVINTHFGLGYKERKIQAKELLGTNWIESAIEKGPLIVCGDLNSYPHSSICKSFEKNLRNVQNELPNYRQKKTWASFLPFITIDYIYATPDLKVASIDVPKDDLTIIASDHLPIIADLRVQSGVL